MSYCECTDSSGMTRKQRGFFNISFCDDCDDVIPMGPILDPRHNSINRFFEEVLNTDVCLDRHIQEDDSTNVVYHDFRKGKEND